MTSRSRPAASAALSATPLPPPGWVWGGGSAVAVAAACAGWAASLFEKVVIGSVWAAGSAVSSVERKCSERIGSGPDAGLMALIHFAVTLCSPMFRNVKSARACASTQRQDRLSEQAPTPR